ncbi:MAG: hypothetical protein M1370_08735 [Bacteroidetes bacterium]|nr:hypothetical protein [Bacteroidota bacterium]
MNPLNRHSLGSSPSPFQAQGQPCAFFYGGGNGWIIVGGYAGMLASLLAFYASAAIVLNSTARREMLPF